MCFFFKEKTAFEIWYGLVGSEMCIRDRSIVESVLPFLAWLPLVNRRTMSADLTAGLTGAVVVLPQSVAFATIAGMPPEYGLYAGMIPAVVAALYGPPGPLPFIPLTLPHEVSREDRGGGAPAVIASVAVVSTALIIPLGYGARNLLACQGSV